MLNKKAFVSLVYEIQDGKYTKKNITEYLDIIIDGIKYALFHGYTIKIVGFGTFDLRKRKKSKGRNPQNYKEEVDIPEKNIPRFKPMNSFKKEMN